MPCSALRAVAAAVVVAIAVPAGAATISFTTDPFEGSDALTTPGRQVVGGEDFVVFDPATDVFAFHLSAFGPYGIGPDLQFFIGLAAGVPASGANVIVLQDDDVPFLAGIAANLIAAQVTSPGAGFFIYFNSNLDLPRLVFSTDLSSNEADLKILARLTNLSGLSGRAQLESFTAENFTTVPEPSTTLLLAGVAVVGALRRRSSRRLEG